jgi:hypothetical protein
MTTPNEQIIEARHRIGVAAGAELLVAGLVLVMFVLPAEFAVDPLGTGAKFGLLTLVPGQQVDAQTQRPATRAGRDRRAAGSRVQEETVEITLAAREDGIQYGSTREKPALLVKTSAPVNANFTRNRRAPRGCAQS